MECIFLEPAVANLVKLSMLFGENRIVQPFKMGNSGCNISMTVKPLRKSVFIETNNAKKVVLIGVDHEIVCHSSAYLHIIHVKLFYIGVC